MCAVLKRNGTHDQAEQNQHNRQVEAGERGGVGGGEGREQSASCGEQPYLVAIPRGADGAANHRFLALVFCDEGREDACAQVGSVKDEVSRDKYRDKDKPKYSQCSHRYSPAFPVRVFAAALPVPFASDGSLLCLPASSTWGPTLIRCITMRAQPMIKNR